MLTWEMIAEANFGDSEDLVSMQDGIREALAAGEDPGPAVALALVNETSARIRAENALSSVAGYVLGLEARLIEAGLRFAQTDERILG